MIPSSWPKKSQTSIFCLFTTKPRVHVEVDEFNCLHQRCDLQYTTKYQQYVVEHTSQTFAMILTPYMESYLSNIFSSISNRDVLSSQQYFFSLRNEFKHVDIQLRDRFKMRKVRLSNRNQCTTCSLKNYCTMKLISLVNIQNKKKKEKTKKKKSFHQNQNILRHGPKHHQFTCSFCQFFP